MTLPPVVNQREFLRANALLKVNVEELLKRRNRTKAELSRHCRMSRSWLDKALSEERRSLPVKYLDYIADFFGVGIHVLFQHGLNDITERRTGRERRTGKDRRLSQGAYGEPAAVTDWMNIIRALSDKGKAMALHAAQEVLNDEIDALRRPRTGATTPGGPDRTAESTRAADVPVQKRQLQRGRTP